TRIFGPQRIACLRSQLDTVARELGGAAGHQRDALSSRIADVDRRIDRQLAAIEAGVDPIVVGERIRALKLARAEAETGLADVERAHRQQARPDFEEAREILHGLPDLGGALRAADPQLRRRVYEAFRLSAEIDRNAGQIRLKALVSSAFTEATDLEALVANGAIAGAGFEPATFGL
ncbi:MAG: hypothetical protein ACRDL0_01630, partial [Thermoleophilaceae bacterium]